MFQAARLDGFHCAAPEVCHAYKHKHMKTAFSQLPQPRDGSAAMSSKVQALMPACTVQLMECSRWALHACPALLLRPLPGM